MRLTLDEVSWREDLSPRASPARYALPMAVGLAAQVVVLLLAAVLLGLVSGIVLMVTGWPALGSGSQVLVSAAGVLVVAAGVAAAGLATAAMLRRDGLDGAHARAVGFVWALGLAVLWWGVSCVVSGSSLRQWVSVVAGVALGGLLVLLRGAVPGEPGRDAVPGER